MPPVFPADRYFGGPQAGHLRIGIRRLLPAPGGTRTGVQCRGRSPVATATYPRRRTSTPRADNCGWVRGQFEDGSNRAEPSFRPGCKATGWPCRGDYGAVPPRLAARRRAGDRIDRRRGLLPVTVRDRRLQRRAYGVASQPRQTPSTPNTAAPTSSNWRVGSVPNSPPESSAMPHTQARTPHSYSNNFGTASLASAATTMRNTLPRLVTRTDRRFCRLVA